MIRETSAEGLWKNECPIRIVDNTQWWDQINGINPLVPRAHKSARMAKIRGDHQNNFLWASQLWVCRQKEPILGYVPKNYKKKNSCSKRLTKDKKIDVSHDTDLYFPYSTIPPKTRILVPSTTKPYAAHPGGTSPLTGGTNHWFVAAMKIDH